MLQGSYAVETIAKASEANKLNMSELALKARWG
jgi:hypothetical protein